MLNFLQRLWSVTSEVFFKSRNVRPIHQELDDIVFDLACPDEGRDTVKVSGLDIEL